MAFAEKQKQKTNKQKVQFWKSDVHDVTEGADASLIPPPDKTVTRHSAGVGTASFFSLSQPLERPQPTLIMSMFDGRM